MRPWRFRPKDQGALTAALPGLPVHLVPNGVDTQRYLPAAAPATVDEGHRLLFIGALDYRPNVDAASWFVQSVMPLLRDTAPAARIEIVGRSPGPVMRGLASANVTVAGDVADDVPYFQRASVFVLPMRFGGGSRLKLLQALACGLPVVTTSAGAWGVEVQDGEHCVIADGAAAFAAAIAGLLRDPGRAADLGRRGRALAQRYDWDAVIPRLEAAYASVTVASEAIAAVNVSLVITVLNEAASLPALLGSIEAQTRLPDEVVVVDGGSVDGTWQWLDSYAGPLVLKAFRHPGSNIAQGRNRAIEAAVGDVVAVTDGGVHLVAEWLEALLRPLEAAPGAQAVAGFFLPDPHSAFEVAMGATVLPSLDDITPETFLPSSRSVAFRKSLWREVGGYPEWLDYCEDVVFDFSILAAGQRFAWAPQAVAYFRPRASLRAFILQYYRYARGDGKARLWPGRHLARNSAYAFCRRGAGLRR